MILSFTGVVQSIVNSTFLATYTEHENDVPLRPVQSTALSVHGNSSTIPTAAISIQLIMLGWRKHASALRQIR